jgi:hypothetical protein
LPVPYLDAQVARGDLGAELPLEEVPFWQSKIIQGCRWVLVTGSVHVLACYGIPCVSFGAGGGGERAIR